MSYSVRKFLSDVDLFHGLHQDVISDLVSRGVTLSTPAGTEVVHQGSTDAGLQVILEGSAEVTVNGEPRGSMVPGQYFGEISLIDGAPRSASLVAGPEGLKTFALSALAFRPVMTENNDVAVNLLTTLCARIRSLETDESAARR